MLLGTWPAALAAASMPMMAEKPLLVRITFLVTLFALRPVSFASALQIFRTAFTTDNNISLTGSAGKVPYRFSYGNLNQEGILKVGKLIRNTASIGLTPRLFCIVREKGLRQIVL